MVNDDCRNKTSPGNNYSSRLLGRLGSEGGGTHLAGGGGLREEVSRVGENDSRRGDGMILAQMWSEFRFKLFLTNHLTDL